MYNTTKNATTCESSFQITNEVNIVPIKVGMNSSTNITIYTDDDSFE